MATIEIYKACIATNKKTGLKDLHNGTYKPNLKRLFGIKELVNKRQFERCGETEQRRHLYQDRILRLLYIKGSSDFEFTVNKPNMVTRAKNVERIGKVFTSFHGWQ